MRRGWRWLVNTWGRGRASDIAAAYRRRLAGDDLDAQTILSDLARYCNVGNTSFTAGDPHATAFNEGARDVFNHVAEMIGLAPEDFRNLFKDHTDDD